MTGSGTLINRRALLSGVGASAIGMGGMAIAPLPFAALPFKVSFAKGAKEKPFILVSLHGGPDGQALTPLYGEPDYYDIRGALSLPPPDQPGGILALTKTLGLHPGLEALAPWWDSGQLHIATAIAGPYQGIDYQIAHQMVETGSPLQSEMLNDGWLNRALSAMDSQSGKKVSALAFGTGIPSAPLPASLEGAAPAGQHSVFGQEPFGPGYETKTRLLYTEDPVLQSVYSISQQSGDSHATDTDAVGLDSLSFIVTAQEIARTLTLPDGPRTAVIEIDGWNSAQAQGAARGPLARRITALAEGLAVLAGGFGDNWKDTVILVMGSAGRTVRENTRGGTNPGIAGSALVLSGGLDMPQILGDLASLTPDGITPQGGLVPTLDVRSLLKGILSRQWGLSQSVLETRVFPGSKHIKAL